MTAALVMSLPALLCAVLAWDLCRPATDGAALPSRPAWAVGALLGSCGAAVLAVAWLPSGPALVFASAGAGALVLTTVGRRPVPTAVPAQRPPADDRLTSTRREHA